MHKMVDDDNGTLSDDEIRRLESIRDNIEELLHMIAGIRRDPNAVALASFKPSSILYTAFVGAIPPFSIERFSLGMIFSRLISN